MNRESSEEPSVRIGADVDVTEIMSRIKGEVERKREAGLYPRALEDAPLAVSSDKQSLEEAIDQVKRFPGFSMYVPVTSSKPVLGPLIRVIKTIIQRAIGWYMIRLYEQWNDFASRLIRAVVVMGDRVATLESRVAELEKPSPQAKRD